MSNSNNISNSITKYCALERDSIRIKKAADSKKEELKKMDNSLKTTMEQFLRKTGKTCIPVTIPKDLDNHDETQTMYLRLKKSSKTFPVTEGNLSNLVSIEPNIKELNEIYETKGPNSKFVDIYAEWLFSKLKENNTTVSELFTLDKSKERSKTTKKSKKRNRSEIEDDYENEIKIPDEIKSAASQFYFNKQSSKIINSHVRQRKTQIKQEQSKYEPELLHYLETKTNNQKQKITMKISGDKPEPFYLKRTQNYTSGSVSVIQSKPLLKDSIVNTLQTINHQYVNTIYSNEIANALTSSRTFRKKLLESLVESYNQYKEKKKKQTVSLNLNKIKSKSN